MTPSNTHQIPVAIYTRKSTDAKLEQDVNSITVQRASAQNFILSQAHLGWNCLDEEFTDNNISGATLERPALQRLMKLIEKGMVKVVVVNRLDRISRSLSQFLDLMAFFEKHGIALVSVTQNINTGDAMGRLMLQIIMSFAEFERELIRDRVTERMHAARKSGRFIGGRPPLGYNIKPEGGGLETDELEALRVREIFELYLELRSVKATVCELRERGWHNKKWITREGKVCGGSPFSLNGLHSLLTNPIYIGKVTLKGEVYDGKHEGIIDACLFEQVQRTLAGNSVQKGNRRRNKHEALLKGLLRCKACDASFVHTYTKKKNRIYRYYTCSHKRLNGADSCPSPSIPAGEIEALVVDQLMSIGTNPDLQNEVYRQLTEAVEKKRSENAKRSRTARQQLDGINRELIMLKECKGPHAQILHLETRRQDAENALEQAGCFRQQALPYKDGIVRVLRVMHELWPSFNAGEKCAFVKALVRQVEYDAVEGQVTLHFNDEGFMPSAPGGEA